MSHEPHFFKVKPQLITYMSTRCTVRILTSHVCCFPLRQQICNNTCFIEEQSESETEKITGVYSEIKKIKLRYFDHFVFLSNQTAFCANTNRQLVTLLAKKTVRTFESSLIGLLTEVSHRVLDKGPYASLYQLKVFETRFQFETSQR